MRSISLNLKLFLTVIFTLLVVSCSLPFSDKFVPAPKDIITEPQNESILNNEVTKIPEIIERSKRVFRFSPSPDVKIALLVPLSGKFKKLGQSIYDAAELALFYYDEPQVALMPIDTKGTSFGALEAAKEAIQRNANIILGPVFSKSAKAIIETTLQNQINVVSFSNDTSLSETGAFALGFRPEEQIQRIITYSMNEGLEDFTAVIPNNAFGAVVARELRVNVEKNPEASVLKTAYYLPSHSNSKLRRTVFSSLSTARNKKPAKYYDEELEQYSEDPIKYPRGMLIPEGGSKLKSILGYLDGYQLPEERVKILGSSNWFDAILQDNSLLYNKSIEGAWFATPELEKRIEFRKKFQEIYGYTPVNLASLAYDGVALAVTLSKTFGDNKFTYRSLTNPRGFRGINGIFRFRQDGLSERGLAVVEVDKGNFKIISPSPRSFANFHQNMEYVYIPKPEESGEGSIIKQLEGE